MKMEHESTSRLEQLHGIVEQRISGFLGEMAQAGWDAEDVAKAIRATVQSRVPERDGPLRAASNAISQDFVSDGNEG